MNVNSAQNPRMRKSTDPAVEYAVLTLAEARYAVLPERVFLALCRRAGVKPRCEDAGTGTNLPEAATLLDHGRFARRLVGRRRAAGLTQAELARRAGVRVETLNRLERGRTTPDFGTVRKLVEALNRVERQRAAVALPARRGKE